MKIVITSCGKELHSKVDSSFGRAKWFIFFDTETDTFEACNNRQNVDAPQGAGIQAGQNVANLGVDVVLTGNIGPNALRVLKAASIKTFIFKRGVKTVGEVLSEWKDGCLQEVKEATTEGHWV